MAFKIDATLLEDPDNPPIELIKYLIVQSIGFTNEILLCLNVSFDNCVNVLVAIIMLLLL